MNIELIKEIINSWKDDIEFTFIELLPNVIMDRSKGIIYYTILPPIGDDSGVIIIFDQCFPKKILKFYSHDRSIENLDSERRMTIKRGYFIRDKYDKDSFISSNTIKRTVIIFYISFGMINSDSTNVDLIRNYYEFESLEVLKERFESLGYNCQVDYFYQRGNSPSARMSVYHK